MTHTEKPATETVLQPQAVGLARTYAEALLVPADSAQQVESLYAELAELADVLAGLPGTQELFSSPVIGTADRQAMVERIFGERVSRPIANLLGILAENGRLGLVGEVARQLRKAIDERSHRIDVTVRTAIDPSPEDRQGIVDALRETFQAEPNVYWQTDPELLGGLVVQVGDAIYDASLAGQIGKLADRLGAKD